MNTPTAPEKKKMNIYVVTIAAVTVVALLIAFIPQRSVAAYCRVLKEEKSRLADIEGTKYTSYILESRVGDLTELLSSYSKLSAVAPEEIRPDVEKLHEMYKNSEKDSSNTFNNAYTALSLERQLTLWASSRCKE